MTSNDHIVPMLVPARLHRSANRRLRIGMIAPPLLPVPPRGYGGIERVVAALVEGFTAAGHEVTLFAAAGSVTSASLIDPIRTPLKLGDPAMLADELYHCAVAYSHADEFDIIHDHTGSGAAFGAVLSRGTPVVHTLHGQWTAYSRRLFGLIGDRVRLVAISHAQRVANAGVHYAGVVYNGIDLDAHPLQREKEDYLVFLGRMSPEKRPDLAIDVARASKLPLVMITKICEPSERAYFEKVIVPRLSDDVSILEEPPQSVKVGLLGRARALLFPIDWPEPFGLVMTEAMACGTPVIARPLGAAPEVLIDGVTGFLCSTTDQMVDAVDAVRGLRVEDCRRRVERYFSARAMVNGYERVYRDTLAGVDAAEGVVVSGPHLSLAQHEQATWR